MKNATCGAWYSQNENSVGECSTLQSILEDFSYTCGASFDDLSLPESLSGVVVRDHRGGDVIEALYYSAGFEDICVHCAATADLVKVSENSYPMCFVCNRTKEHIKKSKSTVRCLAMKVLCILVFLQLYLHVHIFTKTCKL